MKLFQNVLIINDIHVKKINIFRIDRYYRIILHVINRNIYLCTLLYIRTYITRI